MKKTLVVFVLLTITAMAQSGVVNLSGIWEQKSTVSNDVYKVFIYHKGAKIRIISIGLYNNKQVVSSGEGTVKNGKVEYDYDLAVGPSGWDPGHVSLVISPDGKTLTGTYRGIKGNTGPVTFTKLE